MRIFLLPLALIFAGCASGEGSPVPFRLTGSYQFLGDGDLCFIPSPDSARKLSRWKPRSKLCFSNTSDAIDLMGVREAFGKVGYSHICGFEDKAAITVTDLLIDDAQEDWLYQARLASAENVQPYTLIRCDG